VLYPPGNTLATLTDVGLQKVAICAPAHVERV
jgi:hypothetical protein